MTDIPLRDAIAASIAMSGWGESLRTLRDWQRPGVYEITDALLREFDISLRSPHPTPDANEERDQPPGWSPSQRSTDALSPTLNPS